LHTVRAVLALACSLAATAVPAQVSITSLSVFRDNEGANAVGAGSGDNLTVSVRGVSPNLSTVGFASNAALPGLQVPLKNVFLSNVGFFTRTFAADVLFGGGGVVDTPWTVTLQNRNVVAQWTTNSLASVGQLPMLQNLQVTGSDLAPTLQWSPVATAVPYDEVRLSIYDIATTQLVWTERVVATAGSSSYTLPPGLLAPGNAYSFRVYLWDTQPGVGLVNRSSTYVDRTTSASAVGLGTLRVVQGGVDAPLLLAAGANSLPNGSVWIGTGDGDGSARLGPGTSLDTQFLNLGLASGRTGTLVIDGGRSTLTGGTWVAVGGATTSGGGFATIGRSSGSQGFLKVVGGGELVLAANGFASPGFTVGRDAGSAGDVRVQGAGSRIVVQGLDPASATAADNGALMVGRSGDGRLTVTAGGQVLNAAAGETWIGRFAGSRGYVRVAGTGSLFDAGLRLQVGPAGEGVLRVEDGGRVAAGSILIGPGGVLTGDGGTLQGLVKLQGGLLAPGNSPGRLTIVGDLVIESGTLQLEALSAAGIDGIDVQGAVSIAAGVAFEVMLGYAPSGGTLDFITATGGVTLAPGFGGPQVFALAGSAAPLGGTVTVSIGGQTFAAPVTAPVPEPGSWALFGLGLAAVAARLRPRRRGADATT
jgi:T5SS/PEP-CTERM-associated repeat protein